MLHAGQPAEVVPLAADYAERLAPGRAAVLPLHRPSAEPAVHAADAPPSSRAIVVANLVNAALNWMLIFGHWARPRWACSAPPGPRRSAAGCSPACCFALAWRALAPLLLPVRPEVWQSAPLAPDAAARPSDRLPRYVLEFGAFALVALMMGWLGTRSDGRAPGRHQPRLAHLHGAARGGGRGLGAGRARGRPRRPGGDPGRGAGGAALRRRLHGLHGGLFLTAPVALARLYTRDLAVIRWRPR